MITVYTPHERFLKPQLVAGPQDLGDDAVWIDLIRPSEEERRWVAERYGVRLPSEEEVVEIEFSSRFFVDEVGLHLRSFFLYEYPDRPHNVTVAFILSRGRLFSLRSEKLETFHLFRQYIAKRPDLARDAVEIMLRVFEIKVDLLADTVERLHTRVEETGQRVFGPEKKDLESILRDLNSAQDVNDQIRLGMVDKERVLSFLRRSERCPADHQPLLEELLRDIDSLSAHSMFLVEKTDSLMNTTMGYINIEQNKIIKIFSIAAVVFLPPTLVASIYGMNFHFMPELKWIVGYPMALGLMVISGIAPYLMFKRKGWL